MRKIMRRILSYLCAVCMLFSSVGDLGSYIYAAKTLPVILTKTLAASDGETYEIAASFEVRVPEDWDEERDGDYLDSLNVELAVRELNAPEEPEPEEEPGSPEDADPVEEADPADDTPPANEAEPIDEPEAAEEPEPEEEPEYEYSYEEYVEKAAAALECESGDLACVRVFDISLRNRITGEELQPESSVKVSIRLLSHDAESGESLNVVHFGDEPEVLESSMNEEAVEFETESFSVFVVLGTVLEKELTASDGKEYRITVSYDRASGIPADAVLCVTEIKEGDEGYGAYVAAAAEALGRSAEELILARPFDITLMDPSTGEAFQPNRNVAVSIQLLQDELGRYSDVNVLHFPGEEGDGPEVMASALEGEAVTFRTDGFSVFVLTGSNDEVIVPQCTFTFYVWSTDVNGYTEYFFSDDQNRPLTKQTVKNGSELIIPQMTSTDTEVFAGWYEGNTDGAGGIIFAESSYDFEHITITENSAVDLYAVYKTYGNVIFHDQYDAASGSFPVAFTRRTELTTMGDTVVPAPIRIDDLAATYNGSGTSMAFFGWSETPVTTPGAANDDHGDPATVITADADGCITISGDKHLYPVFKEIHWLTFYAAATGQGAAYNGPQYLFAGDTLGSLPVTSRNGYDFTGWFTGTLTVEDGVETVNYGQRVSDENGNLLDGVDDAGVYVTNGGLYLRSDTRLFAGWASKNTADYRVIYWKQAGSAYLFDGSEQFTADVGAAVSAPDGAEGRYSDYHMKEAPAPVTVSADGSTVLHIYYDRNEDVPTVSGTYTLHFADSITEEGKTSADLPQTKELANGASLAGYVIETPASGRMGYAFSKWYLDPYCTVEADFDTLTMPDQDLTVYAGWELEWYVVRIDPNYGELRPLNDQGVPTGTGSTWFWQTIEREPVAEYTYVERNYVESSSGTWYYVNHQGDGLGGSEWPDRYTYYTQDPSKATEDTTFEYAPGEYTYAGWYEVHEDGTETPYLFGERTDHNTLLKLHWKRTGVFHLAFAAGEGTLDDGSTKEHLLPDGYADYADIVLTESAHAPEGYSFIGWRVRGSDSGTVYMPGKSFTILADDAQRVSGKDVVTLEAVYVKVGTAGIVYDANGGTLDEETPFDYGSVYNSENQPLPIVNGVSADAEAGTATVAGLTNNQKIRLSRGDGLSQAGFTLAGWSNKAVYDPRDPEAKLFDLNGVYGVDREEPIKLYAVWETTVTWHLNNEDAAWGEGWPEAGYTDAGGSYTKAVYRNNSVAEPSLIPVYNGTEHLLFRYWAVRTGTGTAGDPYQYTEYDFAQPVTGAQDLYAFWEAITVAAHAVDASSEALADKTGTGGWSTQNIRIEVTDTELNAGSHVTAPAGEGYVFAFAAAASDLDSVGENSAVTAIRYDSAKKRVCVKYAGASDFTVLESGKEIYFVYYRSKLRTIGYKSMGADGALSDVISTGASATDALLGEHSMGAKLPDPLSFVPESDYAYFAFAVGGVDTHSDPQMNASDLSVITNAAGSGEEAPTLRLRNTWRGFQYTTEAGDDASWVNCGYDPYLYVVYFTQRPTIIIFREETVGNAVARDTEFAYDLLVTQTVSSGTDETTTTVYDSADSPYMLKAGEQQSAILFYRSEEGGSTTTQTITVTQRENTAFDTTVSSESGTAVQPNSWTYTSGDSGTANQTVTFTNTHKAINLQIRVALVEPGGFIRRDDLCSTAESDYTLMLPLGAHADLLTALPSSSVFTGDPAQYAFVEALYGYGAESSGEAVTVHTLGGITVAYEQIEGSLYDAVLKDSKGNRLGRLGSEDTLYYLYCPMPMILYMKESHDGSLTRITGCIQDPVTGVLETIDSVAFNYGLLTMNGITAAQEQRVGVPLNGLLISQSGNNFRMPSNLDDGAFRRYLLYEKLGVGDESAASVDGLDYSTGLTLQLQVRENTLQYSFDGQTWKNMPLSGIPTIYAIYTERGYDLQISKTVDTSASGENAIFSDSTYTVTISSAAITKGSYESDGAENAVVAAIPAAGGAPGTITLTVRDGSRIRIKGLGQGEYTVTESGNDNYTLTAKKGHIVGSTSSTVEVEENTTISLTLDSETRLDLTNSPKALCKIGDQYFYTLRSMVEYVDTEIADKTANVEMLTDYVMNAADTVEIPSGAVLTIETAEEGFSGAGTLAVITRTAELADVPLITNHGSLTIKNLVLDGNGIDASAPMIRSSGDLTVGISATIRNGINHSSGEGAIYGGAINAAGGNLSISGIISGCSAETGGAVYYTGNGSISLSGQGKLQNNTAASGNGGGICMTGGTLSLTGTASMTGNKAENGAGGAVYAENAVINVGQKGSMTGNTAKQGGAVYVGTGTVTIAATEGYDPPAVTGNTASTGSGGAVYIGNGSLHVSGGSLSNNKAESGMGGAVYAESASVAVSGTAEMKNNAAQSGGAVYTDTGAVTVSGGSLTGNTASTGSGGAVCAQNGMVTLSDKPVLDGNKAENGLGGAVYASTVDADLHMAAEITDNSAGSGGGIYAMSGTILLSASTDAANGTEVSPTVTGNRATTGSGGAIWLSSGTVTVRGGSLSRNEAKTNGGAVYTDNAGFTLNSASGFTAPTVQGNRAEDGSGGAVYSESGTVAILAGTVGGTGSGQGNTAGQNGGAISAVSGAVTMGAVTLAGNGAGGLGGAVYIGSGAAELSSTAMSGNRAENGAAVYVNSGKARFSAVSCTGNIAEQGGAVGIGSTDARLTFSGDVQIVNNTLGAEAGAPNSNVYLDRDSGDILTMAGLGANADIGIYVPDSNMENRGVPGARFAGYTSDANIAKIRNDRNDFSVQKDTATTKLFWGKSIKVEVRYLDSFAYGFPPAAAGTSQYTNNTYYPEFSDAAISELATELYNKDSFNPGSGTAVYAVAFAEGAAGYADYITELTWNSAEAAWTVTKCDGSEEALGARKIIIYYAEPAYISIENNSGTALQISGMKVNGSSVINVVPDPANGIEGAAGYGTVFAKNGAIRTALLPVTADDLNLENGRSVTLLIPGGRNMSYTLDGSFQTAPSDPVRIRKGASGSMTEGELSEQLFTISGTTLNGSGTYSVIFGTDKAICKIVDANETELTYSKISAALDAVSQGAVSLTTPKTAVIEMLTDYLLPASDKVEIPRGYDITLTTASTGTYRYIPVNPDEPRATISRDSENTLSMIESYDKAKKNDGTVLRLSELVIDGKAVRGSSDGGAVRTRYCNVYVDHVDFKNVYAGNGGALYVIYETDGKMVAGSLLQVENSTFTGCNAVKATGSRLGGGAIHTSAETFNLKNCTFDSCQGADQAGAVFHRVDGNYNSWTNIDGCTFTNCRANAAGGLELDSKTITVTNTSFTNCVALQRNGGGFNVYALNSASPTADCRVTLENCTFTNCQANNFGGGFRSTAVYTKVMNCSFTNTSATGSYTGSSNGNGTGGAIGISSGNAKKAEIYACTITGCTAIGTKQTDPGTGGGIYYAGSELIIGDSYTSVIEVDEENNPKVKTGAMSITNCTARNAGGGIYHKINSSNTNNFTMTNTVVTGNTTNNSTGGGIDTRAKKVTITGGSISNNTAKNQGGGLYTNASTSLSITGTTISGNTTSGSSGGGVYYTPDNDTDPLTVNSCTIENNSAANGNGGGIYTTAGPITVGKADGYPTGTVIRGCTAKSGGGIYHDKNTGNAFFKLLDSTVSGCRATNGGGGGIRTDGWVVTLTGSTVSNNSATSNGGGLWLDGSDANRNSMSLTVNGSTVSGNTSGGNGGGIYTLVKTVALNSSYPVGTDTVTNGVNISGNTAAGHGGGLYHDRNAEGSALTVTGTEAAPVTVSGNKSTGSGKLGGGIYANVHNAVFTWAEISGNRSEGSGGGVYQAMDGAGYAVTVDHTAVTGNTSGSGGGIYTKTNLYLRNDSLITGNRLTGNTEGNAAGVYLQDNRTLYVGSAGATEADSSSVKENYTAAGTASNLRLWWNKDRNDAASVYVYCPLNGSINVVNADKVGTQFGTAAIPGPEGFTDDAPVFRADAGMLHGIIDRTDETGTRIIWAGKPVAKITDGNGNLLYLRQGTDENGSPVGTSPAIFDRLYSGSEGEASIVGAFNVLNSDNLGLSDDDPAFDSSKPMLYNGDGTPYTGTEFCVKMLVETFTSDGQIFIKGVEGRTVTFTTAGTADPLYPSEAKRATVHAGLPEKSLLNPRGSFALNNIVIDGSNIARTMWCKSTVAGTTVTLGESAILQNGKAQAGYGGGGVYLESGTFEIKGGVIRNCTAPNANNGGGAVYLSGGIFNFEAGNIIGCTAVGSGGGVFQNAGTFNMSGGTISGCTAKKGGGVLVQNNSSAPFHMSGGSIVNNTASETGGGIAVNGAQSRIFFSRKVTVSGNRATKNGTTVTCNLELDQNTNNVINIAESLYPGSYIGVYVPGTENTNSNYDKHGVERTPFGTFVTGVSTTNFYSFVNDRNGLKGGIIEKTDAEYAENTIYWIKIFALQVSKTILAGSAASVDPEEPFLFRVNIRGTPSVAGQLTPAQIDSSTGVYGEMEFTSNGTDTTTAVFALKNGESITGVNLSEGLDYEIIEYLIVSGGYGEFENQHKRYAAMPMNGFSSSTESLTYNGTTYTVVRANTYSSKIGENKSRTDVDPYTSAVPFTNIMPVCKITDKDGKLLYRRYTWEKTTNKTGEQQYYYAPAVYTELTGDQSAFQALAGNLYSSNGNNPSSYAVSNGIQIQMLVAEYTQTESVTLPAGSVVTLMTASASDTLFPKQDAGTTSTVRRGFAAGSMYTVNGDMTVSGIILDGVKGHYTVGANGGIFHAAPGGKLTIREGAALQNSRTNEKGGAVYAENGSTVVMTGGTVNKNESVGDGAGIYLEEGSTLQLSGSPSFGGKGTDAGGNITTTNGNWKDTALIGKNNGGKPYEKPRQDIFIAGWASDDVEDTSAAALVVTDDITTGEGTIWVWSEESPRYLSLRQFARIEDGRTVSDDSLKAFRNARDDADTLNGTDSWLYGCLETDHLTSFVCWSGNAGARKVILRKVGSSYLAQEGAVFELLRNNKTVTVKDGDKNTYELKNLTSASSGVIWIGTLPYGNYALKEETGGATYWFALTVSAFGVSISTRSSTNPYP